MGYLLYGAADSAVAKVGIDLDQEVTADNGGLQLCVALVGRDDGSPPCYLHTMLIFSQIMKSVSRSGFGKRIKNGVEKGFESRSWKVFQQN